MHDSLNPRGIASQELSGGVKGWMAFWESRLILKKNSTLKDLGPRPLESSWEFWTLVHLEEPDLPVSDMLCLMLSSEIQFCVLLVSFSYFTVSAKVSFTACYASAFATVGVFFPFLPWVLWFNFFICYSYLLFHAVC